MPLRILYIASLHYPERLQTAIANTPAGEAPPLFPPNMAHSLIVKAMRKRGHTVAAFYRNHSAFSGMEKTQRHTQGITPAKVITALSNRMPPRLNADYRLRNRHLIEQSREFKPDVLWMAGDNRVIYPETLAAIKRETGCKIVYACGTSPIVFSHPIERAAARLYDMVMASDYYHGIQWLELGAPRMECLPLSACDPDFHRPYALTEAERAAFTCDIAFVGTLVPDNLYSRRVEALEALRDFDLGIWSVHEVPASLRAHVRGKALDEDMLKILSAAKLTINTHGDFVFYGGNIRLFESAGVGIAQMSEDLPGVREWFTDGENIIIYKDTEDLRAKVAYYLSHDAERQALAQRAREHVYAHHTYDQRVETVEQILAELR